METTKLIFNALNTMQTTKKEIAELLGISRPYLDKKLRLNLWTKPEVMFIKNTL